MADVQFISVHKSGRVSMSVLPFTEGQIVVRDDFYPLCADAVQTNVLFNEAYDMGREARIRPDTYTVGGDSAGDSE